MQSSKHLVEQCRFRLPRDTVPARGTFVRRNRRWLALLLAIICAVADPLASPAQQPEFIDREPEIKAAYLYNFGRYVEWPAEAQLTGSSGAREFVIGIIGDTPVSAPLATIAASKKVNGRAIAVRKFQTEADFRPCQILFVPAGKDLKLVSAILKRARATATLVVGEETSFAGQHGQMGFYAEQNSVKFEINAAAADKAGLKISSKLLSLGRIVGEKPGK